MKKCKVVTHGEIRDGFTIEQVKKNILAKSKQSADKIEQLFDDNNKRKIIAKNVDIDHAKVFIKEKLFDCGLLCDIIYDDVDEIIDNDKSKSSYSPRSLDNDINQKNNFKENNKNYKRLDLKPILIISGVLILIIYTIINIRSTDRAIDNALKEGRRWSDKATEIQIIIEKLDTAIENKDLKKGKEILYNLKRDNPELYDELMKRLNE